MSMKKVNPKYIIKNYMLQEAIDEAKKGFKTWGYDQLRVPFICGALLLTGFILGWFVMSGGGLSKVLDDKPQGGVTYPTP